MFFPRRQYCIQDSVIHRLLWAQEYDNNMIIAQYNNYFQNLSRRLTLKWYQACEITWHQQNLKSNLKDEPNQQLDLTISPLLMLRLSIRLIRNKNVEKVVKHSKKRVCPCNQSLGVYWLIQCSNKLCNQGWHTRCANVPGTMNEEVVNKLTNDGWLCPWCFSFPFPRPANHPVAKNDLTCIVASTATQICEAVRKNITTDASCLKEELNEMYKAVSIDQNAISEEISESLKSM